MRPRTVLAIASSLTFLIVPLIAAPVVAADHVRGEHLRIMAFWTPGRLAAARPRELTPIGSQVQAAKSGGGGSPSTGGSWTRGGPVLDRTGKVYFQMNGGYWQCSGSIARDALTGESLVVTAGHCAIDATTGEFATNWMFMPNWDSSPGSLATACSATRYGCWTAIRLYVHFGFATAGGFNEQAVTHDWAFALVGPGGLDGTTELDQALGSYPLTYTTTNAGETLGAFGYPAGGKYHANDLTYCAGPIFRDLNVRIGTTWGMPCDMTGGSSGGPWFDDYNASRQANWKIASLTSYGYGDSINLYGPKFNANTQATYEAANSRSGSAYGIIVGAAP